MPLSYAARRSKFGRAAEHSSPAISTAIIRSSRTLPRPFRGSPPACDRLSMDSASPSRPSFSPRRPPCSPRSTPVSPGFPGFSRRPAPIPCGQFLFYPANLLLVAAALWLLNGASRRRVGLPPRGEGWLTGRGVSRRPSCLLGLLALAVRWLFPGFDDREFALRGLDAPGSLPRLLLAMPWAAATEELVYRSCQERPPAGRRPGRRARGFDGGLRPAPPGSAEAGAAHRAVAVGAAGLGGLILGWLYEKTGRVGLAATLHLAFNLLAVTQARLHVTRQATTEAASSVCGSAERCLLHPAPVVGEPKRRQALRGPGALELADPLVDDPRVQAKGFKSACRGLL